MKQKLDAPEIYKTLDTQDMFRYLREMPEECRRAWELAGNFKLPPDYTDIDKIVILGMGGSAIGGDLVASLAVSESTAAISVVREYNLPAYVGERTLVIANSYSGNTEETLSAFGQSLKADCKRLAITTGGKLAKVAQFTETPLFTYQYQAQPRAALAYSLVPLLRILQSLGLVKDKGRDVSEAAQVMDGLVSEIDTEVPQAQNAAKQVAAALHGKMPVVYGAEFLNQVACRWKTQLNENSKSVAFYENFSELNHNTIVGYGFPAETGNKLHVVILKSPALNERIQLRQKITIELLQKAGIGYQIVEARGKSILAQMLGLVLFGDFVSCYLAMLNNVDPTPVAPIDYLKQRLSE